MKVNPVTIIDCVKKDNKYTFYINEKFRKQDKDRIEIDLEIEESGGKPDLNDIRCQSIATMLLGELKPFKIKNTDTGHIYYSYNG